MFICRKCVLRGLLLLLELVLYLESVIGSGLRTLVVDTLVAYVKINRDFTFDITFESFCFWYARKTFLGSS